MIATFDAEYPISSIIVERDKRQRKKLVGIEELAESIKRIGLLHPPVITMEGRLVVGERRLSAYKLLERETIPVHFKEYLDDATLQAVELEENLKRVDLSWQDTCSAISAYHELKLAENPEWNTEATADALGVSRRLIADRLMVQKELASGNPLVTEAPKFSVARGIAVRQKERRESSELEKTAPPPIPEPEGTPDFAALSVSEEVEESHSGYILNESFNDWAPHYDGKKFNLIHCDFPYGVNADKFNQGSAAAHGGYKDDAETYWQLLDTLCNYIDNIAAESCHLIFWFSMDYYEDTLRRLSGVFDRIDKRPLLWYKNDNKGILPDPNRGPRWVYETAFFASRGDRKIIRPVSNVAAYPITSGTHMSEKTQGMLEHFFTMVVDEHTSLLDPTCGSGSAIRAGLAKGAGRALGLEINGEYADLAEDKLRAWQRAEEMEL